MERRDTNGEDMFNTVCGDLGLGSVNRGSHLLKYELEEDESLIPLYHLNYCDEECPSSPSDVRYRFQDFIKKGIFGSMLSRTYVHKNSSADTHLSESDKSEEVFPTYADVPYGTSYRQQKKLYEQQMGNLRQQQNAMILLESSKSPKNADKKGNGKQVILTSEELDAQIQQAMEEMDELKLELDACCKRLDAKYQAVAILKKQAEVANTDLQSSEKKFYESNKRLEKEVSKLQFELEWKESSFMDSQQTWAERFDRVCQDNALLMSKLEARCEDLRRTIAHKTAIARERDELLALLDVSERMKYEHGKSMISEEEYGSFSSTELAVLGACKCRGANPEPCGCAHAAANLRKEVAKLREEIKETNKRRQEAYLTVDAYRLAFEEQMAKSRQMSQELATISTLTSRSVKAKAAMKFLLKSLSDDEENVIPIPTVNHIEDGSLSPQNASTMTLQELVQALTDVVHKKEEALAQQKLAAQMLANKLNTLEKQTQDGMQHINGHHHWKDSESLKGKERIDIDNVGSKAKNGSVDKYTDDEQRPLKIEECQDFEDLSNEDSNCLSNEDSNCLSKEDLSNEDSNCLSNDLDRSGESHTDDVQEDGQSQGCHSENSQDSQHDCNRNEQEATADKSKDFDTRNREGEGGGKVCSNLNR